MPTSERRGSAACTFLGADNCAENRAEELCLGSERGLDNSRLSGEFRRRAGLHRCDQVVASFRGAATQDDERRIEEGGDGNDRHRQVVDHVFRHLGELWILCSGLDGFCGTDLLTSCFGSARPQGASADEVRQVSLTIAILAQVLTPHDEVADLTGRMLRAPVKLAIDHDPSANASSQGQEHEIPFPPGGATPLLTQRCGIRVVLDGDGNRKMLLQALTEREVDPSRQVSGLDDLTGSGVYKARNRDADADKIIRRSLCPRDQRCDLVGEPLNKLVRTSFGGGGNRFFDDDRLAVAIPHHERGLGAANVDANHDGITIRATRVCQPRHPFFDAVYDYGHDGSDR